MNNHIKNDQPCAGIFPESLKHKIDSEMDRILAMRKKIGQPMMFAATQPIPEGYVQIPTEWIDINNYSALFDVVKDRDYVEFRDGKFKINDFILSNPLPGGGEILIPTAELAKDGVRVIMKS